MHQKNPIQTTHDDLVTDASYDFYGLRLATGSVDQHIKVWGIDPKGTWTEQDSWKAHDATITTVTWAHPEFGSIIASAAFDTVAKVWEQTVPEPDSSAASVQRWVERAALVEARGSVRSLEFAPHHFGLKLATIASDSSLRIYDCSEQPAVSAWQLMEEIDVPSLRGASSSSSDPDGTANTAPSSSTPLAPDAHLPIPSANAFGQSPFPSASNTLSTEPAAIASSRASGSKEADGGWDISWCKDHYWGEILAVAAGTDGLVKIIQLSPSRRPTVLLVLDKSSKGHSSPITSVAWAPACGRSYQLIATGSRDGFVRIWQVQPPPLNDDLAGFSAAINGEDEGSWTGRLVGDFHHHESLVSRVEWNVTGTILSSAGNDGKVRLWKRSLGATWRSAGFVSVEAAEQDDDAVMSERPQHD